MHIRLAIASVLLACGVASAQRPPLDQVAPAEPGELPALNWQFRTETHWLMTIGAESVVQLVTAGPRPAVVLALDRREADAPSHFGVRVDGKPTGIVLEASATQSIWSPETYLPIVYGLTPGLKPDPTPAEAGLVAALTDARVETIAKAAQRVSADLSAHRRAPALHEAGALLLTALALREGSRHFDDQRLLLTRAAAHLAVADALRGRRTAIEPPPADASTEGRLARATLAALAGRQVEALAQVAAMRQAPPAVASWLRAIEIRTRLDWRVLPRPAEATLLERLQHTQALAARTDGDDALAFVETHAAEDVADWSRILLQIGFSVEAGNTYARRAIGQELREITEVHQIVRGLPVEPRTIATALNQPPSRGPRASGTERVEIVDWPLWADILQRHLADALLTYSTHLRTRLGVDDWAAEYERAVFKPFGALRLHPFVDGFFAQQNRFPAAMAALQSSWATPEQVPPHAWMMTIERIARSRTPSIVVPPTAQWFAPVVPLGTVPEDVFWRTHAELGQPRAARATELDRWRALAPHKRQLAVDALALTYGEQIPAAAAERALAPFLAYDTQALRELGQASDSAGREAAYRRMCTLTADQCGLLAWELLDQERDADAAAIFRRLFDGARDRVMASTESGWLVAYEHDHGHASEAWRIATDAASTGSFAGMATLAALSERTGALDKAEALYRDIAARYDTQAPLLAFYLRTDARGDHRYAPATPALVTKVFPQGLRRVTLADFTAGLPPDRGLTVEGPNRRLLATGLREDDVIVAVDGYLVRDHDQWTAVTALSREPSMSFVVYRNGTYLTASGRFPGRAITKRLRQWVRPSLQRAERGR